LTNYVWIIAIMLIMLGFFSSMLFTPLLPVLNQINEKKYKGKYPGAGAALANFAWAAGEFFGPIGISILTDYIGLTVTFITTTVAMALSTGIFIKVTIFSNEEETKLETAKQDLIEDTSRSHQADIPLVPLELETVETESSMVSLA